MEDLSSELMRVKARESRYRKEAEAEIAWLQEKLWAMEDLCLQREKDRAGLESRLAAKTAEAAAKEDALAKTGAELDSLKTTIANLASQNSALQKSLAGSKANCSQLEKNLQSDKSRSAKELEMLRAEMAALKKDLVKEKEKAADLWLVVEDISYDQPYIRKAFEVIPPLLRTLRRQPPAIQAILRHNQLNSRYASKFIATLANISSSSLINLWKELGDEIRKYPDPASDTIPQLIDWLENHAAKLFYNCNCEIYALTGSVISFPDATHKEIGITIAGADRVKSDISWWFLNHKNLRPGKARVTKTILPALMYNNRLNIYAPPVLLGENV